MEELQKLYDVLVREGKYSKSFDEFKSKWSKDAAYKNKVYDVAVRDGLYSKTKDEFFQKYSTANLATEPVQKKKFASESSLGVGSSASQESPKRKEVPKPTTEEFETQFKKGMAEQKAVPKDLSGNPIIKPEIDKALKTTFETISKNKKQKEQKKYSDIFDKQLNVKPNVEDSQYLKDRLDAVNANLIGKEEEYVVPELEYQFGDLGFKFEESGVGDNVKVTAPNGKVSEISLDNLFNSKSKDQSTILQNFIKDNTPAKGLFVLEKTMKEEDKKFNSQKQVDDSIKSISNELNSLNSKQKQFLIKKNQLEKQINTSGLTDQLKQQKLALNEEMKSILQEEEKINQKSKKLDAAVGKYSIAKSKQGTWLGGIWNAINEGASGIAAGTVSTISDIATEIAPTGYGMLEKDLKDISVDIAKKIGVSGPAKNQTLDQWKKTLTEDQLDNWEDEVDDYIKKDFKSDVIPAIRIGNREIFGDVETTKQWSNLKEQDFWGGAILGVAKSLPAIIGGTGVVGAAQRTAQMYAQVSDGLAQEMENDPSFKNISENEKLAVTLPIGIVGAVLENLGLKNIKGSQGLINNIALKALGKAGKGVTAKTFRELVENEVDSAIARGVLTITAAGAAEFETGAAQTLTETKFKDFYNFLKEEKMFDTPDSTADLIENVVVSGAQEALGGFVLGVPTAVSAAYSKKGFLKMDDNTFETFANMANDENMQSAYVTSLKNQITQGIINMSEAKTQLNDYRNAAGLYRELPEGLSTQQKKEAMNLLKEKRDLQNYVEGKDNALVVKQKERITEIDNSLTKLSETDAVQEQSTTEIPVQSETITSETMETRVPESGPEVVTEQATQEEVVEPEVIAEQTEPQTIIEEPTITIADAINDRTGAYLYDGKKGVITTIGQTVVLETDKEIIDLGNIDELNESTLNDFGIIKAEEVILNDDNSINIGEKKYVNNYSKPEAAISQDKDGNYSVTLDTDNGQKRTFRGQQAEQIVYQMKLKNFEQNGTEQDIDTAIELADEAIRIEEEIGQPSVEREGKTTRKAKRKQRTLKQPKEPLTKTERNAQEISILEDRLKLQQLSQSEEHKSKIIKVTKGEPIYTFFDAYTKAKADGSNPELVKAVDNLLAIDYKTPKGVEGMLPIGTEVEINGKKGKITSVSNFFGEQEYKVSFDGNRSGSEYIKVKDFNKKGKVIEAPVAKKPKAEPAETKAEPQVVSEQVETAPVVEEVAEAPAPVVEKAKTVSKIDKEMAQLERDLEYYDSKVQEIEEEIAIEQSNTKEGIVELKEKIKKELEEVKKDKSLSRDEKIDKIEEIKYQIENFKEDQQDLIDSYKEDLKEAKSDYKKTLNKINKFYAQKRNDLLDVDTKDKAGLERVLDYLDNLDSSLDLDPNELNDVTRVMAISTAKAVVKTLKALVKAGITLQEAIKAASEIHSVADEDILKAFEVIEQGGRQKSAPSPLKSDIYAGEGRIISIVKDITKITMREKDLLVKQIKDRAKGARESVQAWKEQSKKFAEELDELVKSGKITNKQVGVILKKFSKVNIFSEKSIDRFTDYMVKVFNDSNYKEKLTTARKTLSSLKRLAKDQTKNANLRAVASEFVKIDPSFVDNIDEYNDIANKLETAVDGSKIRKADVNFVETVNVEETISYIEKTLAEQEEKLEKEKIKEIQDLFGVDASEFSAEEIDALLESDKDISKDDDKNKIIRAAIKKAFDIYSSVIKEMISTGVDPFTEEEVDFDDKQKDIIERFMKIDPREISDTKEALRTVDSLINFIQNKSTAGMLKPIADFEGIEGGEEVKKEGLKAIGLKKYWSPKLGLFLGQNITTLPVLFEKMFKGVNRALKFEELTGIADLINNSSKAESESNKIVKNYVKDFYKRKANGESFNSAYNDIERGVIAHVFRNVIGIESRMKKVFDKRKQEVLDSIKTLSENGDESEKEIAIFLQKAYDKLLDGSEKASDVKSKADANNVEAVEYWTNQWSNKYEALSDLALNFYNKVLGRDLNFTPDRIRKLQAKMEDVNLEDIQSQFFVNTDDILYDKKSGSLMDKQENRSIPKDMYVDFSFDKKNSNAMNDALTDLYTAFDIRKVGSFLKSKSFRQIFPSANDAIIVDKRIKKFVRLTRKKTPFSNDDISDFLKKADKLAKFGVTAALASPAQPFKQTIPVMFSTAMNAGSVGLGATLNKDFNNWLNDLGFAISNRGVESQAEIDSLNKLVEKAADMPLDKALRFIEKTNDKALKVLLVNFDVWIARASFKAYYEQYLKKQGLYETSKTVQTDSGERTVTEKGINYSKHKVNKEAANYAQRMVDRQQNISNSALAGDLFTSDSKSTKAFVKMLMPFSSFRSNQSARLGSDLSTLGYWGTSTKEDKIIALRSIAGYALESAAYRSLQIGFTLLMYSAARAIMGADDEEEDKKTVDNLIKGASQSAFIDTFSPVPLADPFMQDAMAFTAEEVQSLMEVPEDKKIVLFGSQEQSALKSLGTYGIPLQKAKDIYSLGRLAYTKKYTDKYGNKKEINQDQADKLKILIGPLFAASVLGVGSPDATSIVNKAVKMAKKGKTKVDMEELKKTNPRMYKILNRIKEKQEAK